MPVCKEIQSRLAEQGPALLAHDEPARQHVKGCTKCLAFYQALQRLALATPPLAQEKAAHTLVAQTLLAVQRAAARSRSAKNRATQRRKIFWNSASVAAVAVVTAVCFLLPTYLFYGERGFTFFGEVQEARMGSPDDLDQWLAKVKTRPAAAPIAPLPDAPIYHSFSYSRFPQKDPFAPVKEDAATPIAPLPDAPIYHSFSYSRFPQEDLSAPVKGEYFSHEAAEEKAGFLQPPQKQKPQSQQEILEKHKQARRTYGFAPLSAKEYALHSKLELNSTRQVKGLAGLRSKFTLLHHAKAREIANILKNKDNRLLSERGSVTTDARTNTLLIHDTERKQQQISALIKRLDRPAHQLSRPKTVRKPSAQASARAFLAEQRSLENLSFQTPVGYWANTYTPGDPSLRQLAANLHNWDRTALGADFSEPSSLEKAVQPLWQPFDAPKNAALALYLHSDQSAITTRTRLLLQVGIKGTVRQSGLRPAMNVCLVIDLRKKTKSQATALRALMNALQKAHQPGDQFCLVAAGPGGGRLIELGDFRYGTLQVAIQKIFGTNQAKTSSLSLVAAVAAAMTTVERGNGTHATPDTRLVLLASAASLQNKIGALVTLAHDYAVKGNRLSVISLAGMSDMDTVDRLVRAGQGNRRILHEAKEAEALLDRELHSASQAVARAVRLRIRLATGVQLLEVLGSYRLQASQIQRVRAAERGIDQRMAQQLGIRADRGKDDEGIQIVIPHFYANDSHVILLDIVTSQPGLLADVSVHYKDLVYLRNGVAHAQLHLPAGNAPPNPLAQNVLKNKLAWQFSQSAQYASEYLASQQPHLASVELRTMQQLLAGMRVLIPGWSRDRELMADEQLLAKYLALLDNAGLSSQVAQLADSLRYAAYRKQFFLHE